MINKCWVAKSRQSENSSRCDSLVNLSHWEQIIDMYYASFHKLHFWNFKMYELHYYLIKKRLHRPLLKLCGCYCSTFSCNPFVSQLLHILQFYILPPLILLYSRFIQFLDSFQVCLLCFVVLLHLLSFLALDLQSKCKPLKSEVPDALSLIFEVLYNRLSSKAASQLNALWKQSRHNWPSVGRSLPLCNHRFVN